MFSQLIWPWLLSALIWLGPIPLALWLVGCHQSAQEKSAIAKLLLSILTLWCLIQIALGLALGSFHQFALRPVLAIETTLAIAGLLLLCSSSKSRATVKQWWHALAQPQLQPSEILMLTALGLTALVLLQRIATQPFTNYDTLWFHGPIIARWYQTASFSQLDPLGNWIIEHPQAQGYPYNWHVLSVFFLLPWRQDVFMALPMLIAWIMFGLSIYLLSRMGGASSFYALAASTLVLVAPFLLNNVTTLHIDLPLAAIYTVGLYYLVLYHHSRQGWSAFLCLASAGLVAGIKTSGIVYTAVLIILFLLTTGLSWCSSFKLKPPLRVPLIGLGFLVGLGLGGFWYVHNYLVIDNVSFTSLVATAISDVPTPDLEGMSRLQSLWYSVRVLQSSTLTSQFNWLNLSHWALFGSQALVRLQLPLIALLGVVLSLPHSWTKCPKGQKRQYLKIFFALFLVTLFLYWNTPFSAGTIKIWGEMTTLVGFNMRYGFSALGLLGVVAAIGATYSQVPKLWVILTVLVSGPLGIISSAIFDKIRIQSLMGTSSFWASQLINELREQPLEAIAKIWQLVYDMGLTDILGYLVLFVVAYSLCLMCVCWPKIWTALGGWLGRWHNSRASQGITLLLCGAVLIATTSHWSHIRDINRLQIYGGIDAAITQQVEPGQRIAYFLGRQSYVLYGKYLDQQVVQLSFWTNLFSYKDDVFGWIDTLRQSKVALVAIGPDPIPEYMTDAFSLLTTDSGPLTPVSDEASGLGLRLYRVEAE